MKCLILQTASVCPEELITVPTGRKSQPNIRASDVYWNFPFPVREEDGAVLHEEPYLASTIFNMVGIPAQETILGTYDVGARIVCACNNFTADGRELFGICSIKNIAMDSGHGGTRTELEDILDTIEKQ